MHTVFFSKKLKTKKNGNPIEILIIFNTVFLWNIIITLIVSKLNDLIINNQVYKLYI